MLFSESLRVQLIAKGIIRADEWDTIRSFLKYDYIEDNHFSELKDSEILMQRITALQQLDPYVGKYYSQAWVKKNVLRLDEEQVDKITQEIEQEAELQMAQAEKAGMLDGAQQAATQNYMGQNTEQQPADEQQDEPADEPAEQPNEDPPTKVRQLKGSRW